MKYLECEMCDYEAPHTEGNEEIGAFFCSDECWIAYLETQQLTPDYST